MRHIDVRTCAAVIITGLVIAAIIAALAFLLAAPPLTVLAVGNASGFAGGWIARTLTWPRGHGL